MKMPQPNHIDDPEQFIAIKCAVCAKCWRHFTLKTCIHGGPFDGYTNPDI